MIWIKAKSGRLRVDEAAVKSRVDLGWKLVVFVTVILLSEPIVVFIGTAGEGAAGRGVVALGHALAALLLTFLLWTGVPVLRWIVALALIVSGGFAVGDFLGSRPATGSLVQAIHGALSVVAAGILGLSRTVKLYLAHREVGL